MNDTKKVVTALIGWSIVAAIIIVVVTIFAGYYTVDQGERALVLRFGEISKISDPGFHLKIPYIDSVRKVSVRSTKIQNTFGVYSKDIQAADVELSVNYSLLPALVANIYTKYGIDYESRIIIPQILTKAKDAFGRHNAVETVQSRDTLAKMILDDLQNHFTDTGVILESIQIENIDFSDEYERSVEERMRAEVEVAKVQQNLAREQINADMVRTKARGEADARITEAQAKARSIEMISAAEATAIASKAEALAANPGYVQFIQAERWNGELPRSIIPSSSLPILNVTE